MDENVRPVEAARRQGLPRSQSYRMDHRIDFAPPEVEEAVYARILRGEVERLPDEALQERRMVGHVVENFGRRQAPALEPQSQFVAVHALRPPGCGSLQASVSPSRGCRRICYQVNTAHPLALRTRGCHARHSRSAISAAAISKRTPTAALKARLIAGFCSAFASAPPATP